MILCKIPFNSGKQIGIQFPSVPSQVLRKVPVERLDLRGSSGLILIPFPSRRKPVGGMKCSCCFLFLVEVPSSFLCFHSSPKLHICTTTSLLRELCFHMKSAF